ncbi:MAG: undecaprenyl-diphosphate phosphatase [Clostridia bacterium]|nr:undecaprenyl-diphosphate phosphatase [Clostridia bacterium]
MFLIEIIKAILQGIVQGITEWLPVSSTGHILLLDAVWKMDASTAFFDVFKVIIQLGSILAVVVLYFHKLNPFSRRKTYEQRKDTWRLWYKVLFASIPAAVAGLLLDDIIDNVLSVPVVIATALIVYGIGFIWMESRKDHTITVNSLEELSYKRALGIGAFQMLALIPGTSRSGSTILGASLLGTSRTVAAEFSFFMAIPVMLGASGLKMVKAFLLDDYCGVCRQILESEEVVDGLCAHCHTAVTHVTFTAQEWILLAVATVVSFVVSLLVIRFLMAFIKKHSFKPFGWYRIALGIVVLLVVLFAPQLFS